MIIIIIPNGLNLDFLNKEYKKYSKKYQEENLNEFKTNKYKGKSWFYDFKTLYNMVRNKNFSLSPKSYLTITGALAYLALPTDVVYDFIPGVGWLDDAFVLKLVVDSMKDEIKRYNLFISS